MAQDFSRSVTVEIKRKRRRVGGRGIFGDAQSNIDGQEALPESNEAPSAQVTGNNLEPKNNESDIVAEREDRRKPQIINHDFHDSALQVPVEENEVKPNKPLSENSTAANAANKAKSFFKKDAGNAELEEELKKASLKDATKHKHDLLVKRRGSNKIIIQNIDFEGEDSDRRSFAALKRARDKAKRLKMLETTTSEKITREVILPEVITVAELASRMAEKGKEVIKEFMKLGVMVNLSQTVDADTAELVINEFGHKVKRVSESDVENVLDLSNTNQGQATPRPPVVTIMGHVDHGKTSLLDAIRSTNVTQGEAGGITQHIGAYQITTNGHKITFLDTPGHAAFTEMRAKGAKVTDIVVLVVAADDGIKEQTVEAISHAKAANVPIIVAINKIDKPAADPSRVINELLSHDIVVESMGGDVMTVEVSATKNLNLDKLLEAILLQTEVLELTAIQTGRASGTVIETEVDKAKGIVATVLVQSGCLKTGDLLVAGTSWGRIRNISDDTGKTITEATPSTPVRVFGLNAAPESGDPVNVVVEEKQARDICEYRSRIKKEKHHVGGKKLSLEELFAKTSDQSEQKVLPIIIKADVHGSIEAIDHSLNKLANDEIGVTILHKAVGGISESDIALAKASKAIIIAFNVRLVQQARQAADTAGVDIRYYSIIYNFIDDFKALMSGMLSPLEKESVLGNIEIRNVFNLSRGATVGGSFVLSGMVKRGANMRLIRDGSVIHTGILKTLRRFKDDVKEVKEGYECGIILEGYNDIKIGDIVEVYEITQEQRSL